ncbi:hypothetical protein HDU96_005100, partial [Phlyctochytrium bullatum]
MERLINLVQVRCGANRALASAVATAILEELVMDDGVEMDIIGMLLEAANDDEEAADEPKPKRHCRPNINRDHEKGLQQLMSDYF